MRAHCLKRTQPAWNLAIVLVILQVVSSPIQGMAQNSATLKISALPYLSYAPIFIALEEGYFAEQGLELELVKFNRVGQSLPALALGDIDISADSVGSNLFSAVSRGLKLKIVADKGHLGGECCYAAILVRKDLYDSGELRTISQLKGKKIALAPIPSWGYVYDTILRRGNLTLDDIEIAKLPIPATVAALESGAIDASSAAEPLITQLETSGIAVRLAEYRNYVPGYQVSTIIYGPNLLEKNHELGNKFMVAYLKGVRQFNKGKTGRNLEILQKHTRLEADILKDICLVSFYDDGHVDVDTIRVVQDWAYKRGYIDEKIPVSQLVDTSFAEYANSVLEKAP